MKKYTFLLILGAMIYFTPIKAQIAINQDGSDANASSILDVKNSAGTHVFYIEDATGNVAVHNTTPATTDVFSSFATGSNRAINGYAADYWAIYGKTTGTGTAILGTSTGTGDGVLGYVSNNQSRAVVGINHTNASSSTSVAAVTGAAGTVSDGNTYTVSLLDQQTGINGAGNGSGGIGVFGFVFGGSASNEDASAYYEIDFDEDINTHDGPDARIAGHTNNAYYVGYGGYYGGYFNGNQTNYDWAYVGIYTRGPSGTRSYKIVGPGSVSTIVKDDKNVGRAMFCPEAPEILFEDYGDGQLVNGEAKVEIDPILSKNIYVDDKHPIRVFIQLEGDCKGVYVTDKSAKGFTVKELQNGASNVPFSWHIVATRADDYDDKGNIVCNNVNARFPIAPKKLEPRKAKLQEFNTVREKE